MKKTFILSIFALCVCFIGNVFAGSQDFVIDNDTDHNILSIYISSSGSDTWGPDRLNGYLNSGESTKFTFTNCDSAYWDIKVVYRDNKPAAVWNRINLKKVYKLVLRDNASGGTTATKYEI